MHANLFIKEDSMHALATLCCDSKLQGNPQLFTGILMELARLAI